MSEVLCDIGLGLDNKKLTLSNILDTQSVFALPTK